MVWHIGNTTVRTPYRLREALIALQGMALNGNLQGKEQETAFARLLHEEDVVYVQRIENDPDSDYSDLGRKWRSALGQLGFITHDLNVALLKGASAKIDILSGKPFEITPNGYRLIQSEPIAAQQEAFLRSLLAYRIPSPIETRYKIPSFNPLKFVIDVIYKLEELKSDPSLSHIEFALFVQNSSPADGIEKVAKDIIAYRARREKNKGQLRPFTTQEYMAAVKRNEPGVAADKIATKAQTLDDYQDLSFRYLKATGLFKNKGRGIALNPVKQETAHFINTTREAKFTDVDYLVNLWKGSALPTDQANVEERVIKNLIHQVEAKGENFKPVTGEDISVTRHKLEEQLIQLEEIEFYKQQAGETEEIAAYIKSLLEGGKPQQLSSGDIIRIPQSERPAYLEWVIWRAFLAINSLVNHPWEARRFQIDQDFLPVNTAAGGGADMIFEFKDAIVVVEVTLTRSSRQEAAEGEPVRRHVAKYAEENKKAVYGLFLAPTIDSNTAHTFRMGDWYLKDDSKINLHIVPITLEDFYKLFVYGSDKLTTMSSVLQSVLKDCRMQANSDAPTWKREISTIIQRQIQ